jgi:hypothetical protein
MIADAAEEFAAVLEEIEATSGEDWGLGRRIAKAAALMSSLVISFPVLGESEEKFALLSGFIVGTMALDETAARVAMAGAVDVVAAAGAEARGMPR